MDSPTQIKLMTKDNFEAALERIRAFFNDQLKSGHSFKKKVLVVGDIGLDKYLYGSVDRISPEAPVPVVSISSEEKKLGLAANVAKNLAAMGLECDLVGLRGNDQAGAEMEALLNRIDKLESKVLVSSKRPTTEKTRVLSGQHHLIRLDLEEKFSITGDEKRQCIEALEKLNFTDYSHVILEDYGKGLLSEELSQLIIKKAHEAESVVLVDPSKNAPLAKFKGADFFKPNFSEISSYSNLAGTENYQGLLEWVLKEGEFKHLISTLGAEGMSLCSSTELVRVPTFARKVFDVTGAGDTVIAALSVGLAGGLPVKEACLFANLAAGFVVGKVGAVPCTLEDVKSHMERLSDSEMLRRFTV